MRKSDGSGNIMKYASEAARNDAWLLNHLWKADSKIFQNIF
jgi:hypothetical protein